MYKMKDIYKIGSREQDKEVIPAESGLVVAGIYQVDYLTSADQGIPD